MDVIEFYRRVMEIEKELALFPDTRLGNPGWWDVVRFDVLKLVYGRMTGEPVASAPQSSVAMRVVHKLNRLLLRAGLTLRTITGRYDVLVYRAPRLLRGGQRVDIAMDQLLSVCDGRPLVIDTYPYRYDRPFSPTTALADRPATLDALERRLREVFAIDLDLDHFVRHRLADHEVGTSHYRRILARVRPRLILLTQNGVDKALFKAAREASIPCIEVQHGLINGAHPAYAYPSFVHGANGALFPDGLLTFSEFWRSTCHYPVRWSVAVGNDEFVPPALDVSAQSTDILVVTADKYNERLSEWMDAIAPRLPDRQFKYKLHPSQSARMSEVQSRLRHLPNVEVIGTDRTMSQALASTSDVVLIQSTAAYEAVQAGRRLVVIREFDSGTHLDLFNLPCVHLVEDVDSLQRVLSSPSHSELAPVFFRPFNVDLARKILSRAGPSVTAASASASVE